MKRKSEFEESSGNVFADIGIANPDEAMTKAQLAMQIIDLINKRRLSQSEAAALLGIDQPKVSCLIHGRLRGFSVERLFRFLNALGREVEIVVRAKKSRTARPGVRVLAA